MIKKVVCVKEYDIDTIIAMRKFNITPPVVGEVYKVIKIIDLQDGFLRYVLAEYDLEPGVEHLFKSIMFRDLEKPLSLDEQIKEALRAPVPLKHKIYNYQHPKHFNCPCRLY